MHDQTGHFLLGVWFFDLISGPGDLGISFVFEMILPSANKSNLDFICSLVSGSLPTSMANHGYIELRNRWDRRYISRYTDNNSYNLDGALALGLRPVSTSLHHGTLDGGLSSKLARNLGLRFSKKALTPSF